MKKIALFTSLVCLSVLTASAQIANTKWKGMIRIPADSVGTLRPFGVTWVFSKDTATVSATTVCQGAMPMPASPLTA